ncbi:hypothetical protein GOBAR_DD09728 [Gossypium barbadense]|nr:hypothetical protein GOBAR_DD09728 [Gossypium barbadense]
MSTHFPLPPFPSKPKFLQAKPKPSFKLCSSLSTVSVPPTKTSHKPFPAEVSRTIMELSSIGTLSTLAQDGWPLGVGVRFAVDAEGTPVCACLNLLLMQCGLRTPQCTIQGSLTKPADVTILRYLRSFHGSVFVPYFPLHASPSCISPNHASFKLTKVIESKCTIGYVGFSLIFYFCTISARLTLKFAAVPDGLKAWEMLKGRPHNVDLILTEVDLPSI